MCSSPPAVAPGPTVPPDSHLLNLLAHPRAMFLGAVCLPGYLPKVWESLKTELGLFYL